jgi:hypothetical protein
LTRLASGPADDPPIIDPACQEGDQRSGPLRQRTSGYPRAVDCDHQCIHRNVRATHGPEAEREAEEVFLADRLEQRNRRLLVNLVCEAGDHEWALRAVRSRRGASSATAQNASSSSSTLMWW